MTNIPTHGSRIVFDTIPAGSYASPGVVYLVEVYGNRRKSVRLVSEATGSATIDAAVMYGRAAWKTAA